MRQSSESFDMSFIKIYLSKKTDSASPDIIKNPVSSQKRSQLFRLVCKNIL